MHKQCTLDLAAADTAADADADADADAVDVDVVSGSPSVFRRLAAGCWGVSSSSWEADAFCADVPPSQEDK